MTTDVSGNYVYTDWDLASADNKPLIKVKPVSANVSDLTAASAAKAPSAVSTAKVGAQALAASIIAAASIASTLF